jgi:hypothetical protein
MSEETEQEYYELYRAMSIHDAARMFIEESNKIEDIPHSPTMKEINEHLRFMKQKKITIDDLIKFVGVFQPGAKLRNKAGLNVRVGSHIPTAGGPLVKGFLEDILDDANGAFDHPFSVHKKFETLHPFTDCNGRAGRMLWLWMMREAPLGFLHTWYYQSLEKGER